MSAKYNGNLPTVVETFHLKPQMSTSWCHYRKSRQITKAIRIHPLGKMNVCTKFCGTPSSRCGDISQNKLKLWPAIGAIGNHQKSISQVSFIYIAQYQKSQFALRGHPLSLDPWLWWVLLKRNLLQGKKMEETMRKSNRGWIPLPGWTDMQ